jgi:hypothetical protein
MTLGRTILINISLLPLTEKRASHSPSGIKNSYLLVL